MGAVGTEGRVVVPHARLLRVGIAYCWVLIGIAVLVGLAALFVPAHRPGFAGIRGLALCALATVPLWRFMLNGMHRRLAGDATAGIFPLRAVIRIVRVLYGVAALSNAVIYGVELTRGGGTALWWFAALWNLAWGAIMLTAGIRGTRLYRRF